MIGNWKLRGKWLTMAAAIASYQMSSVRGWKELQKAGWTEQKIWHN